MTWGSGESGVLEVEQRSRRDTFRRFYNQWREIILICYIFILRS